MPLNSCLITSVPVKLVFSVLLPFAKIYFGQGVSEQKEMHGFEVEGGGGGGDADEAKSMLKE